MLDQTLVDEFPTPARVSIRVVAKAIDILLALIIARIAWPYGWLLALLYLLTADAMMQGQSIGKRLFGLRVVHPEHGWPCTLRASTLRNFLFGIMGLLAMTSLIGQIVAGLVGAFSLLMELALMNRDEHGLRVGDILAETEVIEVGAPTTQPLYVDGLGLPNQSGSANGMAAQSEAIE